MNEEEYAEEYWNSRHDDTIDPRIERLSILTPKQKEILLMRESGLTFSDIARRLNLSRGAVLGRLSRARKAIAQCC
jgi:DNA-binding CsgD family transcriptional regulator